MSSLRLALSELRRITAGRLPKIAVVALVAIPLLYGGLYLYANKDPYSRLDHVPAALVVEDAGATRTDGTRVDAGRQVAVELKDSGAFDWHEVSRAKAEAGVADGRYDVALRLPADFSAALVSSGNFTPRRGALVLVTNDANSYLARTIANQVVDSVRDALAKQVGSDAANSFLLGFADIRDQLGKAVDGAGRLQDGAASAASGAGTLAGGADTLVTGERQLVSGSRQLASGAATASAGADRLASGARTLSTGLDGAARQTAALPAQTRKLATGAQQVADGNARIAAAGDRVAAASGDLVADLDTYRADLRTRLEAAGLTGAQVDDVLARTDQLRAPVTQANDRIQATTRQLDTLATGAQQVATGADRLADATPALTRGIAKAASGASQLSSGASSLAAGTDRLSTGADRLATGQSKALSGAEQLSAGATKLTSGLSSIADGAGTLASSLASGRDKLPDPDAATRKATAETIADPVKIEQVAQTRAGSYGAGLAPFFLSLAAWIGGYVLFLLVRPFSARATAADANPLRVAVGGWLAPALLGTAQVALLYLLVWRGLKIVPVHVVTSGLFMVLASVTFIAIVQALNAWLGTAGQFVALVLMLVQLVSAGGTFPWQTIPGPLYALHHLLPMTYTVEGLRHLLYGGSLTVASGDTLVLVGYLVGALALTTLAARRARVWTVSRIKPELVL